MILESLYIVLKILAALGSVFYTWHRLYRWIRRRKRKNHR